jgi:hypothetical protein
VSSDDGSIVVVSIGVIAVIAIGALWLTGLVVAGHGIGRAGAAADAAALAAAPVTFLPFGAAAGPAEEAARFAGANGSELLWCRCPIDRSFAARTVEVMVGLRVEFPVLGRRMVTAVGRAEFVPALLFPFSGVG